MPTLTTGQIAEQVAGELLGPDELTVDRIARITEAGPGAIVIVGDESYARHWPTCHATAALAPRGLDLTPGDGQAVIRVADPDLAAAAIAEHFAPPRPTPEPGIHPTAIVDPEASVADDARLGPHAVVGPRARIGPRTVIHANVTVLDEVTIGADCVIWPGCVIRERCVLGDRVTLHPNVTIGADGFGYRPAPDGSGMVKIPQISHVEIGDDVEIGASTCIDRGKFTPTTIGMGAKIDNLCQIAHNCKIGRFVVIAGMAGLAGSITIGDGCQIGGMVAIKDHVTIGPGAKLAGCSQVMSDVPAGQTWAGSPAREARLAIREYAAIRKLPDLVKDVGKLKRGK